LSFVVFVVLQLSSADLIVFSMIDMEPIKQQLDSYPELKCHYERIGNIPKIKKWISTRPVTER